MCLVQMNIAQGNRILIFPKSPENEGIKAVTKPKITMKHMASLEDEIKNRRSIRKYTPQKVPMRLLERLLETASYAPSAHNAQPWRFVVITSEERKRALAEAMAQVWLKKLEREKTTKIEPIAITNASVERFSAAPVLILACLSMEDMDTYPDKERQTTERDLAVQSLASSIQNLLLSAHAEGLGACWFCAPIFCKEEVRKTMEIPQEVEPQALITLGYPAEMPKPPKRRRTETTFFADRWGVPISL